ncbi:MAG: hypothetical protein HYZ34_06965 [Ignavibacteriae bacterium]|nr:hypothetical protein [Ignavibacteriota bacterium]
MPSQYLPTVETVLLTWFDNFIQKLTTHAPTIGVTNEKITEFQTDFDNIKNMLNEVASLKASYQSKVKAKDILLRDAKKRIRDQVVIIKRHSQYTEAIGEDLSIIGAGEEDPTSILDAMPEFFLTVMPDMVRADWLKKQFGGVVIESKRGNETVFSRLDKDSLSPYEDTRKNLVAGVPETRTYRMRYLLNDAEVGKWSNEVTVVCLI